jgi:hypothetical protein
LRDEFTPWTFGESSRAASATKKKRRPRKKGVRRGHLGVLLLSEEIVELGIEFDVVFFNVLKEFVRAEDFGDFDELIVVIVAMEEGFFPENHGREHRSQRPHIQ